MVTAHTGKAIPQRRGIPFLGLASEIQRKGGLIPLLRTVHQQCLADGQPALVKFKVGSNTIIYVGEPELIGPIFEDIVLYDKPARLHAPMKRFMMDNGLITAGYEQWKRQRPHARHSFAGRLMSSYSGIISQIAREIVVERLSSAQSGEVIDMDRLMGEATTQSLTRCLFNIEGGQKPIDDEQWDIIVRECDSVFNYSLAAFFTPGALQFVLRSMAKQYEQAVQTVNPILQGAIERYQVYIRQNQITEPWDIVSNLIIHGMNGDNPDERITWQEVCGNILSFAIAGFDTNKSLLKTCLRAFAGYPAEKDRVAEEVAAVLGNRAPVFADLGQMPLLDRFVDEALRYEAPVSFVLREATRDTLVGDYQVEAGALILLSQHLAHYDPRFWDKPEVFDSERFNRDEPRHPYAYFPFAEGERKCIGAAFGKMETKLILIRLLQAGCLNYTVADPDAEGTYASTFQRPLSIRMN